MARQLSKNGQNEQKSSLFCLSHFLPRDPNWADFYEPVPPLKLAPLALLCSQGMLETTWGVFQVAQAKSFDLRGVEAMSVKRFQRYGCFRENFFFEPKVKIRIRLCLAFVFVFEFGQNNGCFPHIRRWDRDRICISIWPKYRMPSPMLGGVILKYHCDKIIISSLSDF